MLLTTQRKMFVDNNNDRNNIARIPIHANLHHYDTYLQRYGATDFGFEYQRKQYKCISMHETGDFGIPAFVKLIRQYFAKRTQEDNTVFFEHFPVSSLNDRQNISVMFNFYTIDGKFAFEYEVRNTDTGVILAADYHDDVREENYYRHDIDPNECNQCIEDDYIFEAIDFDNDAEYAYFAC